MPVDSTHPDYEASLLPWLTARDVYAGEREVKAAGTRYLPKLEAQSEEEYRTYKARALFFNATARTVNGLVGLMFAHEPQIRLPEEHVHSAKIGPQSHNTHPASGHPLPFPRAREMRSDRRGRALKQFSNDMDLLGTRLAGYARNVVHEVILVGRAGTLVDWGVVSGSGHRHEVPDDRAYAVLYRAEDILNWRMERVNGRSVLTMVVLAEKAEGKRLKDEGDDEFESEAVEQIRVLRLVPGNHSTPHPSPLPDRGGEGASRSATRSTQWKYIVEIWQRRAAKKRRAKENWELIEIRTPLRLGRPLPLIPFVFHGPRHALPAIEKLPLADIIAVNLDHYRLDADFKHGLHFTALPTAWVSGFDKGADLRIGASTAWVTETIGATAGFLEFKGQGLQTFERAMDRDERLMAILGSRMLEAQKRVGETAEAIELRQSGENSVLSAVSLSVSASLTQVLRWVYWWNSTETLPEDLGEDVVLIQLNTDFSNRGMASEELTAVVGAWQAGAISRETMFDLFRRGEVLPAGRTDEEEARLAAGMKKEKLKMQNGEAGTSNVEH